MRHILYLVYLGPRVGLGLFMSYLYILFHFQANFHCHESYIVIKIDALTFCTFFRIFPIIFGSKRG